MRFEAIGRLTANVTESNEVTLSSEPSRALRRAQIDSETTYRILRPRAARALFEPSRPAEHAAALAVWAEWLTELHGDNDRDRFHV